MGEYELPKEFVVSTRQREDVRFAVHQLLNLRAVRTNSDVLTQLRPLVNSGIAYLIGEGDSNPDLSLRDYVPEAVLNSLSNLVIYGRADADRAQILHESIERRIELNGIDGVLTAEKGDVYHVSWHSNNEGDQEFPPMVRELRIPVSSLQMAGDRLKSDTYGIREYFTIQRPSLVAILGSHGIENPETAQH